MPTTLPLPTTSYEQRDLLIPSSNPTPSTQGRLKRGLKNLLLGSYKHLGLMKAQETVRSWTRSPFMSVALFHRVTDQIPPDGLTVGTKWFREFCRLMKSGYNIAPLHAIHRMLINGETPPRRTVVITFDDSYADNLAAAEILHEYGLSATFFVTTGVIGTSVRFPWDAHLPRLPNLTWNDVRRMTQLGHDIGSHTVSHPDLATLSLDETRRELADSKKTLEDQLGKPVRGFAFPYGGANNYRPEQIPLITEAGYETCYSALNGFVEQSMAGQVLPRVAMPYFQNLTHMELHINRCLDWLHSLKRRAGIT